MSSNEQVHRDLQRALKQGDKVRVSTLRLLRAALTNGEIAKGGTLEEAEAVEIVMLAAKQRRETIAIAREHGREDVAQQEEHELTILTEYLPEPLSIEELQQYVDGAVQDLGATSPKDVGRVMKVVMPALKGRADGHVVSRLVRERLG